MRFSRILQIYRRYVGLLSRTDRNKLFIILISQILVSFLDVIGIALIGIVGALTITGIQSSEPSGNISRVLKVLNLDSLPFQNQVAIIGLIAATLLLTRTPTLNIFHKKNSFFLHPTKCNFIVTTNLKIALTEPSQG